MFKPFFQRCNNLPRMTTLVAAFLIAAGDNSYFGYDSVCMCIYIYICICIYIYIYIYIDIFSSIFLHKSVYADVCFLRTIGLRFII